MRVLAGAPAAAGPSPWSNPSLQRSYFEKQARLWSALASGKRETLATPEPGDRRFAAKEWRDNPYYDYLKQSYLLAARYVEELVEAAALEPQAKERARFAARQWIDAMCPANFPATNPDALREAFATRGESLARGLANLLGDVHKRRISQTRNRAFEVGRNLAVTPGEVVFENELIQLIQYQATTARGGRRPLVMVPPCINKFYILDLQPENSFVAHAVAAGNTVFMVSWRNVEAEQGKYGWDDYLEEGVFQALRIAERDRRRATRSTRSASVSAARCWARRSRCWRRKKTSLVRARRSWPRCSISPSPGRSACSSTSPASRRARRPSAAAASCRARAGIRVFQPARERSGLAVRGEQLSARRQPAAFDLLYWNSDSTNLPGPMYCYYLRNTYLENRLRVPGALTNCGVPVDLGKVNLPIFVLATREDHIVPWRSAYRT